MKRIRVAVSGFHDGNAGQVADWFEEVTGMEIACFFSAQEPAPTIDVAAENKKRVNQRLEYPGTDSFKGRRLIWSKSWPEELKKMGIRHVLPMDSVNQDRWATLQKCHEHGLELVSAIHPTVVILPQAILGKGIWVNVRAVIGYKAEIADGVMVNTGSILEHHNVVESCAQVDPGVVTGGNVTLRARSHVHMGARIINRIEIGQEAVVGAGSLVRESVPPRTVVIGVPSRHLRTI